MLSTDHGIRPLGPADLDAFLELTGRDPVVNVFAEYRARTTNLEPRWLGGEIWGRWDDDQLRSACHVGANLVPIQASVEDARAYGQRAIGRGRTISTIVGPQAPVRAFWDVVAPSWSPPREERWEQPHLVLDHDSPVTPDPEVRRTTRRDLDGLYPACVAMYTEEVGVSPESSGGANLYKARVMQLIGRGWSFARFDGDELIFKAEVACATSSAAQVQGVYVPPGRRGQGIATAGMAAVAALIRQDIAPVVSLYVNDWNTAARRSYEAAGFVESDRFSTIMF